MELGVNRSKKSPTTKRIKASSNKSVSSKKRNSSKVKRKNALAKKADQKHPAEKLGLIESKNSALRRSKKPTNTKLSPSWLVLCAIAITFGISTILGTTISIASSFQTPITEPETTSTSNQSSDSVNTKIEQLLAKASLGQQINPLKSKIESIAEQYSDLEPEVFLVDLDTKGFVSIRGKNTVSSASTIKLPILVAFFQDLDRKTIGLEEQLTMTKELVAGGSGDMQHQPPGTKFSALETATKMITISDNTATNMLIERLGGMAALNRRFAAMGLTQTKLNNPLPDLQGTNTTTAEDLGNLLIKIDSGKLLSLRSRDRLLHIMSNVEKDTLLPHGIESDALIAHKTGDIKSVLADVGMIDMPNGKRYIASILVKRPDNSPQAQEFIQKASDVVYQYFKNPQIEPFTIESED